MKTLYEICQDKVEVNLSKAYRVEDIQKMLDAVFNGKVDWHVARDIASLLIDVKEALVTVYSKV